MKRIAAIHDIAGFGRSSLATIISVISHMGIQCCPIPTAVFSTHTAIEGFSFCDLTDEILNISQHFHHLNIGFDGIYTGFLASERQIDIVSKAIDLLNADDTIIMVDPVMGDNGKVYKTYTKNMCKRMRKLVSKAHIITPNITEALIILDRSLNNMPKSQSDAEIYLRELSKIGPSKIVITGLSIKPRYIGCAIYDEGSIDFVYNRSIDAYFPGTGDLFASIVISMILDGKTLERSVKKASEFVAKAIKFTESQGGERLYGTQFEQLLYRLK